MFSKEGYRKIKSIIRGTATATAAAIDNTAGEDIEVRCISGNLWINPNATAVATTGIPVLSSAPVLLTVPAGQSLSVISDVTTAEYAILVRGE